MCMHSKKVICFTKMGGGVWTISIYLNSCFGLWTMCWGSLLLLEWLAKHPSSNMFFTSIPCLRLPKIWWQTFQHQFFFFGFSSFLDILQKLHLHLMGTYLTKKEPHNYSTAFSFSSFFPCQKSAWCDGAYISKGGTNDQENKNRK
jgi:hypothetical protein